MVAPSFAIATGIGAGLKAYGAYKAGKAEASLLREQASLLELSADNVLKLNEYNTKETEEKGRQLSADLTARSASQNLSVTQETLSQVTMNAVEEVQINTEKAEMEALQLRIQAQSKRTAASNTEKAGKIAAVGAIISGGAPLLDK